MSLYSEYIQEKTVKSIIETDIGFITYGFPDPQTVYIEDLYIIPNARKSNNASDLADKVAAAAKERGCSRMLGSVVPSTKNSTDSLKVLLAYGMRLVSSSNDFILFSKEL